jgi:hypothetical protein
MWVVVAPGVALLFTKGLNYERPINRRRVIVGSALLGLMLTIRVLNLAAPYRFPYSVHTTPDYTNHPAVQYIRANLPHDTVITTPTDYMSYVYMPEFTEYLTVDNGELYGIVLRGETYAEFWEREQPDVYFGDTPQANEALWEYMQVNNFEQIMPELWVRPALIPQE